MEVFFIFMHQMISMRVFFLLAFLFFSGLKIVSAQDARLSSPWSMPVSMNPSLSGNFKGKFRAGLGGSWQQTSNTKMAHQFAMADVRIPVKYDSLYLLVMDTSGVSDLKHENNYIGVGASFHGYGDDPSGMYANNQIIARFVGVHGSYNFNITENRKHSMGIGAQLVWAQGNVYERRSPYDAEIGGGGYHWPDLKAVGDLKGELNPYIDINLGTYYRYSGDQFKFEAGFGAFHLMKPSSTLTDSNADATLGNRVTFHAMQDFRLGGKLNMTLRQVYWNEGLNATGNKADTLLSKTFWVGFELYNPSSRSNISLAPGFYTRSFKTMLPSINLILFERFMIRGSYEIPLSSAGSSYTAKRFELAFSIRSN